MGLEPPSLKAPTLDVWIIILGETVTRENFELCSQAVDKSCVPKHSYLKGETAWRYIVGCLLPQFTMRQRHVARRHWSFTKTKSMEGSGKAYLTLTYDPEEPRTYKPALGFSWAETGAAMVFAHSLGLRDVVINMGVGLHMTMPQVSAETFVQSHLHQLTKAEEAALSLEKYGEERVIRRLTIILSLKEAYLKAMGQPVGFDLTRICCDVARETVSVDGQILDGWEFRIFTANIDSHRKTGLAKHLLQYLVVVACFRGWKTSKFIWPQNEKDMGFVKFFDVSQIIADVPRLGDYDNAPAPMPPIDQIPLSAKSSIQSFETISPTKKKGQPSPLHSSSSESEKNPVSKYPVDVKSLPSAYNQPPQPQPPAYSKAPPPNSIHVPSSKTSRMLPIHPTDYSKVR